MTTRTSLREDRGAIAVLYSVLFAFVVMPLLAVATTSAVRATTTSELQRAGDSGSLAGAASMPFLNLAVATNYLSATSGGTTTETLNQLGLSYPFTDPLQVACTQALKSATDPHNIGQVFASAAGTPGCSAAYVQPDFYSDAVACANALSTYTVLPGTPDPSSLLPALLRPGLQTTLTWTVQGPFDSLLGGSTNPETTTSIARRRFKNMVVVPVATFPAAGTTINLNPYAGTVGTYMDSSITSTENQLSTMGLTGCKTLLEDERSDLDDAVAPPNGGPTADQILNTAAVDQVPTVVVLVVGSPEFLDFVPVCVTNVSGLYVGDPVGVGACTVMTPGAFRSSVRSQ